MLSISSVSNFRDVAIGPKMKKNLLFRCAKLSTLNSKDIVKLENIKGLALIVIALTFVCHGLYAIGYCGSKGGGGASFRSL